MSRTAIFNQIKVRKKGCWLKKPLLKYLITVGAGSELPKNPF